MELNYLIYFRTVAKTEHISQAAAELHITQPALSRAISRAGANGSGYGPKPLTRSCLDNKWGCLK